jgi:uncharacterized membrane protein YgaE (UPF0421/DUF939 family)
MKKFRLYNFVGGRIVKTGIAVFVTALICHLLDWPAMFAVITAIVTIEPTAADSIKKAFVRFPASAIGAGFSVLATFLFGDSPFSYAFVALATIIACHKLRFHDGTLVATLTGVAMISTVHDHYMSSFFIRLATTSTGLIVSSLVNLFVMPPNYTRRITTSIQVSLIKAGDILCKRGMELIQLENGDKRLRQEFHNFVKEIEKIETLCQYQKDEWKYHRYNRKDVQKFHYEYQRLTILRQAAFHIGNLIYLPSYLFKVDANKQELISSIIVSLKSIFYDGGYIAQKYDDQLKKWREHFSKQKLFAENDSGKNFDYSIHPETVILYELLSIYDLLEDLSRVDQLEAKRQNKRRQH